MKYFFKFKTTIFYVNIFWNVIYSCDGKSDFLALLLQSSVSHDPSEIILICWFATQKTFLNIINIEKQLYCCKVFFVETVIF